jgi:hypothetical protein
MKQYSCSGTYGDTYITCVKLFNHVMKNPDERIQINHYTAHDNITDSLWDMYYKLLGKNNNVSVTFTKERDTENMRIHSDFETEEIEYDPFPNFTFDSVSDVLDEGYYEFGYSIIFPKAGKEGEKHRIIPPLEQAQIIGEIGDSFYLIITKESGFELMEVFQLIREAKKIYCYQGLMAYVAMSQRTPVVVYIHPEHEVKAFKRRVCKAWEGLYEIRRI